MPAKDDVVQFIRTREYTFVKELGIGACGRTVLLYDDTIEEHIVCKKYQPIAESERAALFENFRREIKLLHQLHHPNVVRVFNQYVYPDQLTGYILMEYVDGQDIGDYVASAPERINELFLQAIDGFQHLESLKILHRDVRSCNLMVRADGMLKIIDLGFGKQVQTNEDFNKSISLNAWCDPPREFRDQRYDFRSEVYFVGKLFEKLLADHGIEQFKHMALLGDMCRINPDDRVGSFSVVQQNLQRDRFREIDFDPSEKAAYRKFVDALTSKLAKIENKTKYVDDVARVLSTLNDACRRMMLEETAPDAASIIRCFVDGGFSYYKTGLQLEPVRGFLNLLRASPEEKKRIILANVLTRLDAIPRFAEKATDDEIPF